jgi:hypothetical protein
MTTRIYAAISVGAVALASGSVALGDNPSRRALIPSDQAQQIAGRLFPEQCGGNGKLCGITYDNASGCKLEFIVLLPTPAIVEGKEVARVWVRLDSRGSVASASGTQKGKCSESSA